jgi:sugar lactone lactonase YvrE
LAVFRATLLAGVTCLPSACAGSGARLIGGDATPKAGNLHNPAGSHLFVENPSTITEYTLGGRLVKTIKTGFGTTGTRVGALALDGSGFLYAVTGNFSIAVYAPSSRKLVRTITDGVNWPYCLATDASGNLYVGNGKTNSITVYPPGGKSPLRTITQGVLDPAALALDSKSNLYVANLIADSVTVYSPDGSLLRTVTEGVSGPQALALDRNDRLFVGDADYGYGRTVTIYTPPHDKLVKVVTKHVVAPWNLAVDSRGVLYVSNANIGTVTVYRGSRWKLRHKLEVNAEPGHVVTDSADNL